MAPSGDLGTDHDRSLLPGPSETYGVPAISWLGFTLHTIVPKLNSVSAQAGPYFKPFLESI